MSEHAGAPASAGRTRRGGAGGPTGTAGVTRGRLLRGAALAGAGAALAACEARGGGAGTAGTGATAPVTLTLWDRKEALYPTYMEKWLPTFYARRPHITVD